MQWTRAVGNHHWIFYFITACGAGILLRSVFDWGFAVSALWVVLSLSTLVLFATRRTPGVFLISVCVLGAALGVLRMEAAASFRLPDALLQSHLEQRVVLEGVVVKEPDEREGNQLLTVSVSRMENTPVADRVLVSADLYVPVAYGDRVLVSGKLSAPEDFETDSGNVFHYTQYLAKDGIHFRMFYPEVEVVRHGEGNRVIAILLSVKHAFLDQLSRTMVEPHVSLLGGLLVGAKQALGEDLLDSFRRTGVVHIVVLSGYNMTLIAEAVMRALAVLPQRLALGAGAGAIVLFALMTGASATIVRASAMALLVLLARATGRVYGVTRALFITAFLMLMHNPYLLAFDPSFQLSFLATLGLIQLSPRLEPLVPLVPTRWGLRSLLTATLATQLFVLPLLLYQTGALSVIAVLANLLVLPLIPATMLLGFLAGLTGFLHPLAALPFALMAHALLSFELAVVELLAQLPFAVLPVSGFPLWGVFLLYGIGALVAYRLWGRGTRPAQPRAHQTINNKTA